jgi:RimJ/RimL family protein N-acetyltransferase
VLRRFSEADVPGFLASRSDPVIARYQSWDGCTSAEATEFVRCHHAREIGVPGQWLQIAVALKETNALIGDCALKVHAHDARQATIGGTLARRHHWRGYPAEALACLLDGVFSGMKLHRVVADTDTENTAAWTLMERLGLRREGHLKQSLWFKRRWVDEYLYAILRDEWLAHSGRAALSSPI